MHEIAQYALPAVNSSGVKILTTTSLVFLVYPTAKSRNDNGLLTGGTHTLPDWSSTDHTPGRVVRGKRQLQREKYAQFLGIGNRAQTFITPSQIETTHAANQTGPSAVIYIPGIYILLSWWMHDRSRYYVVVCRVQLTTRYRISADRWLIWCQYTCCLPQQLLYTPNHATPSSVVSFASTGTFSYTTRT